MNSGICDCCSSIATHGTRCKDCVGIIACGCCGDWEEGDRARDGICRSCRVVCDGCGWERFECACSEWREQPEPDDDSRDTLLDAEDIGF